MTEPNSSRSQSANPAGYGWARSILPDYDAPAARLWLFFAAAGALALAWALYGLTRLDARSAVALVISVACVIAASFFPVRDTRGAFSVTASDLIVFLVLAGLGPHAAVVAVGCDALVGTWRASKRTSSRIFSPAAGMAGMALAGFFFELLAARLRDAGLPAGLAALDALVVAAALYFVVNTISVATMLARKRGQPFDFHAWLQAVGWFGALTVTSALAAGVIHLHAQSLGARVYALCAAAVMILVWLTRRWLSRRRAATHAREAELERAQQAAATERQRAAALAERTIELQRQAHMDVLTGLLNRRGLDATLALRDNANDRPLALAVADIDHFKHINDRHSHMVGDEVLRRIGAILRQAMRGEDIAARLGGEEFVLVLGCSSLEQGQHACERIRRAIAEAPWREVAEGLIVSISFGLAQHRQGEAIQATLARADALLYRAKVGGRDQVVCERDS